MMITYEVYTQSQEDKKSERYWLTKETLFPFRRLDNKLWIMMKSMQRVVSVVILLVIMADFNVLNRYMTKDCLPWLQCMPAEEARTAGEEETTMKGLPKKTDGIFIDLLTVIKMKEILKGEGLEVRGGKRELQDRLKRHLKSVMGR